MFYRDGGISSQITADFNKKGEIAHDYNRRQTVPKS